MHPLIKLSGLVLLLTGLVAAGSSRLSGHSVLVFGERYEIPRECALMVEPSLDDRRLTFACDLRGADQTDVLVFQAAQQCSPEALAAAAQAAGMRDPKTRLLIDTGAQGFRYRVAQMRSGQFDVVAHIQVVSDERVCAASFSNDAERGRHLLGWIWAPPRRS